MAEPWDLHVEALSVRRGERTTLHAVSLGARFGEVLAVLGPNGAGKSTLLSALAGLVEYTGEVRLAGERLDALRPEERARRLSYVPQHSRLSAALPVHEVVRQGRYAHRRALARLSAHDRDVIDQAMREADVTALAARRFSELSFGEQKRVMIARALATEARTLLLDEPTASLDIEHALRLFVLLRALAAQGRAIVVVLHQLDDARRYADRAALLKEGRLVAVGESRAIIDAARVRELYHVDMVENAGLAFRLPEGA
jgi:iron complex transport system ATP-binding protein